MTLQLMAAIFFDQQWWAQHSAEWWMVSLTALTFAVLCKYAWDTRKIANASVKQLEASQTPFLSIVNTTESDMRSGVPTPQTYTKYWIRNHGSGPAMNIIFHSNKGQTDIAPLGPTECREIPLPNNFTIIPEKKYIDFFNYEIDYESLGGRRFKTISTKNDTVKIQFKKLS